jgi:hypothetical protein
MKNIRKRYQRRIWVRLHCEVFVQHSVHDVQLPIPGSNLPQGMPPNLQRRIDRMYYILKVRGIIKYFAVHPGMVDKRTGTAAVFCVKDHAKRRLVVGLTNIS